MAIRSLLPPARQVKVISARWQRRALFLLGGIAVGAAAVAMALLADRAQLEFRRVLAVSRYAPLLVTPAGFALAIWLARRYFPNSQGSGIPQVIAARRLGDEAGRRRLVSLRIAIGKIALTLLALLCGASAGREGPTVQVGASVMFAAGRLSPRRQPGLILAGAAAGIASAFNTPLAGIVFGIEEMSRSFELRTSGLVIGTVIAAGLVSQVLLGDYTYFGSTPATLVVAGDWLAVPVCGVVGGVMGGLFSRLLIATIGGFGGVLSERAARYPVLFAAACGVLVAICGLLSGDAIYGTGYDQAKGLLAGAAGPGWQFGILKMAATLLSSMSGIPGGIFSPSLAVGAGFGANLAVLLPTVPVEVVILLAMVSYFAGVVQAPITAFVIVAEMTNDHAMMVPLMGAALIAYGASRLVCKEGIYHALSKSFG
jgi:H+/Cl- antiporter ClcA